jgi:hypothetical protein
MMLMTKLYLFFFRRYTSRSWERQEAKARRDAAPEMGRYIVFRMADIEFKYDKHSDVLDMGFNYPTSEDPLVAIQRDQDKNPTGVKIVMPAKNL